MPFSHFHLQETFMFSFIYASRQYRLFILVSCQNEAFPTLTILKAWEVAIYQWFTFQIQVLCIHSACFDVCPGAFNLLNVI